jgi:trans-feruloyl-CoA hydratase/vanillin synthase
MSERLEEETVSLHIENRIAWVSYNRPEKRNCMSPKLNRQMLRVLESIEFREDVGVVVLTGEGAAFSAGMDLQEYFRDNEALGLGAIRKSQREAYGWWDRLRWFEKPTIGMVQGWAFGGAYGPLHALDIVVASEEARFGLSEINWGILPGGGASKVAQELMPFRKAMYHAMMGENLTGRQAEEQGLVTECVAHDQLRARVIEIAEALLKKDANALRATKWAMRRMTEMTFDNAMDYLIRAQEGLNGMGGAEARKEATKQFLDDKTFKPGLGTFDTSKIKK